MTNPEEPQNHHPSREWVKSSFDTLGPNLGVVVGHLGLQGEAEDVVDSGAATINIVDAKQQTETPLGFTSEEWKAFVLGVKAGEFDFHGETQSGAQ